MKYIIQTGAIIVQLDGKILEDATDVPVKGPYWDSNEEIWNEVDYCPRCGERDCIDCEDLDDDY